MNLEAQKARQWVEPQQAKPEILGLVTAVLGISLLMTGNLAEAFMIKFIMISANCIRSKLLYFLLLTGTMYVTSTFLVSC